jgi:hypothetical protein
MTLSTRQSTLGQVSWSSSSQGCTYRTSLAQAAHTHTQAHAVWRVTTTMVMDAVCVRAAMPPPIALAWLHKNVRSGGARYLRSMCSLLTTLEARRRYPHTTTTNTASCHQRLLVQKRALVEWQRRIAVKRDICIYEEGTVAALAVK